MRQDRLVRRVQRKECVAVAHVHVVGFDALVLLADEGPKLVELDRRNVEVAEIVVMQAVASYTDANTKAHDRVAVNAREAFDGTNAHALGQSADDGDLLVKRKNVGICHLTYPTRGC